MQIWSDRYCEFLTKVAIQMKGTSAVATWYTACNRTSDKILLLGLFVRIDIPESTLFGLFVWIDIIRQVTTTHVQMVLFYSRLAKNT